MPGAARLVGTFLFQNMYLCDGKMKYSGNCVFAVFLLPLMFKPAAQPVDWAHETPNDTA
jgi:hypothetical protein